MAQTDHTRRSAHGLMEVRELIEVLEDLAMAYGDDARVLIATQESWPFENSIAGVAVREEFEERGDGFGTFSLDYGDVPKLGSDIVLVEGKQLAYGNRDAWNAARRW